MCRQPNQVINVNTGIGRVGDGNNNAGSTWGNVDMDGWRTLEQEDHNKIAFHSVFALFLLLTASQAMQWMLSRIMTLNLLSLYSLMFALFVKTHTTLKVETTKIVNRKYHPINLDCSNINHDFQFSCKFTPSCCS